METDGKECINMKCDYWEKTFDFNCAAGINEPAFDQCRFKIVEKHRIDREVGNERSR